MKFVTDLGKGVLGGADSTELWNEVISHIPDKVLKRSDVKILNVACGHMTEARLLVARMRALGKTAQEANNAIVVLDKYSEFTNAAKMMGFKNVVKCDFMEWETDMKFDVVVGNPPYQSNNGSGTISGSGPGALWAKFAQKSISLTKEGGLVAYVTPDNILRSTNFSEFKGKDIKYNLKVVSDSTHYFNVGQDTLYWILENQPYQGKTTIDGQDVDLRNFVVVPKKNLPLYKKVSSFTSGHGYLDFSTQAQMAPKDKSDKPTARKPYAVNANGKVVYTAQKSAIHNIPKVMLPQLSKWNPMYSDDMSASPATMRMLVKNKKQGKNLISLLNTNLYRFMIDDVLKVSGRLTWGINSLPLLDLSKSWTNDEVNKLFKLTKSDIKYLENQLGL